MKLKPFKVPKKVGIIEHTQNYGKFLLEPIEKGLGTTIGHSIRRTLLSAIQGAAITSFRIEGVLHEFSTVDNVVEDVISIILNLKKVRIKLNKDLEKTIHIKIDKPGEFKAGDIEEDPTFEIATPEQHILTVTEMRKPFFMELGVTAGTGYVPSEVLKEKSAPVGTIFIDALYSPVTKVKYSVGNTRVKQRTDYEKLVLEVWTDGQILPRDAMAIASITLQDHIKLFEKVKMERKFERMEEVDEEEEKLKKTLTIKLSELELSVRCRNCLQAAGITTIGELIEKTETEMLQYPNFGRKSLNELIDLLKEYNLTFGTSASKLLKERQTR